MKLSMTRKGFIGAALAAAACGRGVAALQSSKGGRRWYRGMLHMHSHWSDGRALPEQAVAAYKDAGYDFIALSDHNRFQDNPDKWMAVGNGTEKGWPPKVVHPDCFKASYKLDAKDLYVRARVESDAPTQFKRRHNLHPGHHTAWTQPYGC